MAKKIAVYAGTFDPPTNGHLWMIEQGSQVFDQMYVAIGINPEKKCMFSQDERMEMLHHSLGHLKNTIISSFPNMYLISYAGAIGARYILRGVRSVQDYEYERTMRNINEDIDRNVTTFFLIPPRELAEVSSSMVKSLVGPAGWETIVKRYVPEPVFHKLEEAHYAKHA